VTSDDIYDLICDIGAESSKNAKQDLIAENIGDSDFQMVLKAALDPFITYGLAAVPGKQYSHDNGQFTHNVWALLDSLKTRGLTGNAAKTAVQSTLNALTPKSATLLRWIITKDLRAGFSESTVNKVKPGMIPTFDCMLAHPFEEKRVKKWPQVVEPKLDGVRVLAFVQGGSEKDVRFFSRSGREFTSFDSLKQPIIDAAQDSGWGATHFVLDGEVVSGSFNKTVSEVRKKDVQATDAEFHIFDLLPKSVFAEGAPAKRPYSDRRNLVEGFVVSSVKGGPIKAIPRYLVNSIEEIHTLYEAVRARGLEGLIVKDPEALYVCKRSHAWMKIKAEETVDVRIVDVESGTGKYDGLIGALVVDFNGVRVNVGSGLSDKMRGEDFGLFRGRLIEVEYHEVTPDGSLRHPRFKRFRDDKDKS
jgi:DNA ligase 1